VPNDSSLVILRVTKFTVHQPCMESTSDCTWVQSSQELKAGQILQEKD
jgi:hypothetical protein